MDKISVEEKCLRAALSSFENLFAEIQVVTFNLNSECSSILNELDNNTQGDLRNYIEAANSFNQMIGAYVENNAHAISERLTKMNDYNGL